MDEDLRGLDLSALLVPGNQAVTAGWHARKQVVSALIGERVVRRGHDLNDRRHVRVHIAVERVDAGRFDVVLQDCQHGIAG